MGVVVADVVVAVASVVGDVVVVAVVAVVSDGVDVVDDAAACYSC